VRTLVSGDLWVHYGQIHVQSGQADPRVPDPGLHECFAGQQNGLCGGTVPGCLFLITGLHTGTGQGRQADQRDRCVLARGCQGPASSADS
jgi:hypothetical protein